MGPEIVNGPGEERNAKALDMIFNTLPFHLSSLIIRLITECYPLFHNIHVVEQYCLHDSYCQNYTPDDFYVPLLAS